MDMFDVSEWSLITRLTIAVVLGMIVGAQRTRIGKTAGMRTYALVALGAALFITLSGVVAHEYRGIYVFDPLRVASQVVVGIGFIGAGVIFVQRHSLTGLTTAAGLWVVAAIGVACGFGLYGIASYVTFLTLFIFEGLWYIEKKFIKTARANVDEEYVEDMHKNNHHDENEG